MLVICLSCNIVYRDIHIKQILRKHIYIYIYIDELKVKLCFKSKLVMCPHIYGLRTNIHIGNEKKKNLNRKCTILLVSTMREYHIVLKHIKYFDKNYLNEYFL